MMDRRDQTKEERMGDVLASEGFEGRGKLRKASGSRLTGFDPEIPEQAQT